MIIREERHEDYNAILQLTYQAFLTLDYPGRQRMDEHFLVSLLRGSKFVLPELCFVMERGSEIVGHILYTKSEILKADGVKTQTITFGPISVLPKYHRQGIGSALVRHSLEKAQELGYGAVLITGVPDYYPKLGFKRARTYGLVLSDGTAPDAFMTFELTPGSLNGGGEFHLLAPEYELAETDNAGFEKFHKEFINKHYHGQIILRPLWDADIGLLEKWFYMPHIANWYEHPEDWIHEIRNRRGEFIFITHFVAEFDGVALGFCQYYDCYFGQQHEDWYVVDNPGMMFSIDYLIGEPEYLQKGYGREIVRLLGEMLTELGAKRVVVQPDKENVSSCHVLEANGYIYNGKYYTKDLSPTLDRIETVISETARLILRPWQESDAEDLYRYASDPQIGPIAGWPVHTSIENSLEIIKGVLSKPETYAVVLKSAGHAVGSIGLMIGDASNIGLPNDEGEIGYWIGVPFWGQGLVPEAVNEIIRYGFEDLNLKQLWCGYFEGNTKSKRVQEKCGFKYHHTNENIPWPLMNDIRTEHISCLPKNEWKEKINQ